MTNGKIYGKTKCNGVIANLIKITNKKNVYMILLCMISSNKPINKIIFQSPNEFEATVKGFKEVCKYPHYRISDTAISPDKKYSMYANTCSLLGMSNGKEIYLGHYAPELRGANFLEKLSDMIKSFCDKSGEASAFVTGGFNLGAENNLVKSSESFGMNVEIGNILEKLGLDFSMISCKKNPYFTDCLAVGKDAFILSHSPKQLRVPIQDLPKNPQPEQVSKILEDNYEIFEVNDKHLLDFKI